MKNLFICLLFFNVIVLFSGCSKDENPVSPPEEFNIGNLEINPSAIISGTPTNVIVRLTANPGLKLVDSTVKLVTLDANNKIVEELGLLLDNGDLNNGDDILGDNVFSGIINLNKPAGELRLRVVGKVQQTDKTIDGFSTIFKLSVLADFTSQELNVLLTTQQNAFNKLNEFLGGNVNNLESAISQVTNWLRTQPGVAEVISAGTSNIEIRYTSNVYGGIVFAQEDENGSIITRGGIISQDDRRKNYRPISVRSQTVGTLDESKIPHRISKPSDLDPKIIGNRNVLIYAPYEAAFAPHNEGQRIKNILNSSDFEFEVRHLSNQEANISALYNLTDYGYVVLATHGSQGRSFATGEIVDTNTTVYQNQYKALLKAGKLAIWKNIVIKKNGTTNVKSDVYAVRFPFISDLPGTFPNSVILNNSCESTMNNDLEIAFIGKGAKTYYGYSKIVSSRFCVENADTLTRRLAKELKTTGESFLARNDPYSTHNAAFQLKGANDVRYSEDLINGDFEFGKLDGWTKSGDGRVISRLGFLNPTQGNFMGIISTGLGFTEATGSIFQSFRVRNNQSTLTVKWNFLSEEFLEFINSQFQDYFRIIIRKADGTEEVLLRKTIDELAADFGATPTSAGNLIPVSPDIVFDRGGVYMTNWQTSTFNITQYRGQRITIIFAAGDVGDSIYDTAILLDEISVQ
jgi:hypothetical protein